MLTCVPAVRRTVLMVIGTRPEAIKMLPVLAALSDSPLLRPVVISTGQHAALVREVLAAGGFEPDVDLGVGREGITLTELSAGVMEGFQGYCLDRWGTGVPPGLESDYPVATLVHGDTSSAMAAALAAFHLRIPVIHLEAGLRTNDIGSPFPEELNRQVISRIASFHLAPTPANEANLIGEGIPADRILVTGNTAIDALHVAAAAAAPYTDPALVDLETDQHSPVVVVTAHRRENWGQGLHRIGTAIAHLAAAYPHVRFVLPLHPNPVVAHTLRPLLERQPNVSLVAPMGQQEFARLLGRAYLAISDSGGIQEEAPALGCPVLVTRESTERHEGVIAGTLRLVGTHTTDIITAARELLDNPAAHAAMATAPNPYGDGHAAHRVLTALEHLLTGAPAPHPYLASKMAGVDQPAA